MNKKIPMRRCVGCGEMKPKKTLIRVLRQNEDYIVDSSGRKNGRGAYLCPSLACLNKAVKNRGLERSFKQQIPPDIYDRLKQELEAHEKG